MRYARCGLSAMTENWLPAVAYTSREDVSLTASPGVCRRRASYGLSTFAVLPKDRGNIKQHRTTGSNGRDSHQQERRDTMPRPVKTVEVDSDPVLRERRYVDLPWAAAYLSCSVDYLKTLITKGELPARNLGRNMFRVRVADLDALGQPVQPVLGRKITRRGGAK